MTLPVDLTGQVAIVTGGGTGIGEATTRLLASCGANAVISSRKLENLQRVSKEIEQESGTRVVPFQGDVRDEASCQALVDRTIEEFGRVDILVNNAGGAYMFPFLETGVDRFDNNMSLNLRGPYILTQLAARHMVANGGGCIVNISSAAGMQGVRGGAVYSSAKAGLQMLTRVVAAELGPKGIRCNAIAVGAVASEGALRSWGKFGASAESMGAMNPLRRVGQPEDIAMGVLFFVSGMSSWVSGQTLSIDGGPMLVGGLDDDG
ncbi:MAG: short-chain dehydrogenase/reductase [Acidimicrobiia bacterium]|nr:short-chain dehydrogenase/reductase [Acidimicrobiia bacterium]